MVTLGVIPNAFGVLKRHPVEAEGGRDGPNVICLLQAYLFEH